MTVKQEFKSFWYGKDLSPYEKLCAKSFIDHGHSFSLYAYDELDVPDGVELRDASLILPRTDIFFYSKGPGAGSVAAFANRFRYALLYSLGGWWVDMDIVCLTNDFAEPELFFAFEESERINNAMLRFSPRHQAMETSFARATAAGQNLDWGTTGPALLTKVLGELNMTHLARGSEVCYPLEWHEYLLFFDPRKKAEVERRSKSAIAVHLFNEMIRRIGLDKSKAPPKNSYLDELFERHQIDCNGRRMHALQIHYLQQKIRIRGALKSRIDGERKWF